MQPRFTEEQRFGQWWIMVPLGLFALFILYGLFQQLYLGKPFGTKPAPNFVLVGVLLLQLGIIALFWKMRLYTTVDEQGISVRFAPFVNKYIAWRDIRKAEVVNYGFVGGWGIRMGTQYGTVYNVSGNKGLALYLQDGRRYCIGTQQPEALQQAVAALQSPVRS